MLGLDTWQTVLFFIIVVLCIHYLSRVAISRLTTTETDTCEGFEASGPGSSLVETDTDSSVSKYSWLGNDDLYDDFYASVYNKIFQGEKVVQAEVAICLQNWKKDSPDTSQMIVADLCSGPGIASCYLAKQGVGTIVAIDKSPAMMRCAKNTVLPGTTLTETQRQGIDWRLGDIIGPGIAAAAEFTHACMLYFSIYYFRDLSTVFRNLALWVKPGGDLAIEVVNKNKFLPIPDISNPWVAVSPQKYSKYRITKASATFDKFDYETEFVLEDPRAEFKETFRFKDGSVRRQKHVLWMPPISEIVTHATRSGWVYTKYCELDFIGFEYGYILFFKRNSAT